MTDREHSIQQTFVEKLAAAGLKVVKFSDLPTMVAGRRAARCTEIADQAVPEYRQPQTGGRYYSCTGHTAKRWQAAWDGACIALGGDPKEYRL